MAATATISVVALNTGMNAYAKSRAGKELKSIYDRSAQIAEYQAQDALEQRSKR